MQSHDAEFSEHGHTPKMSEPTRKRHEMQRIDTLQRQINGLKEITLGLADKVAQLEQRNEILEEVIGDLALNGVNDVETIIRALETWKDRR